MLTYKRLDILAILR